MDGIRKKMQSLKAETDQLNKAIEQCESETRQANERHEKAETGTREYAKKILGLEAEFDETIDRLSKTVETLDEKEIALKLTEEEVGALRRRDMLLEDENKKAGNALANTVIRLACASREADAILKRVKYFENKASRNEVGLEDQDKMLKETIKMASDNEQKLDELTRKLGVQDEELRRSLDRATAAENKLTEVETELELVGENMKQLEISAEKATDREEKLKEKILNLMDRLKLAEARYEYGEMTVTKLTHRVDDIEDEIYREKMKMLKLNNELDDTFNDMLALY